MSFHLFTSNRLEDLVDKLSGIFDNPLSSPLTPEVVVVQSRGMERWLSLELAERHGICANVLFPFPNTFVNQLAQSLGIETGTVLPDAAHQQEEIVDAFDPEILTWTIMRLLPGCLSHPAFAALRAYLTEPSSQLKSLQLSARVADLFDQYLLFRPEMILRWERGEETHWQAELLRQIKKEVPILHRAEVGERLIRALEKKELLGEVPRRISVFGISAIPEFHMRVLAALSKHSEINFLLLNPCREYWGDILSEREISRFSRKRGRADLTLDLFHFEKGNSILASLGKLGRDFFDLIEEQFDYHQHADFDDPGETSLLSSIQSDILNLREPNLDGALKKSIRKTDKSMQIHSCHSTRREIEVLQDHLLDIFERDPSLKPSDILIMAPDIEPYVPYIQAVFDLPHDSPKRIPFSIADRSYRLENPIVDPFFAILDLVGARFNVSQILNILEAAAVRRKFRISDDDLELIQAWIRESRIRWGKDGASREHMGLPGYSQNTWRAGLDRLLLGYALPEHDQALYDDAIVPYSNVEGIQASALGKLVEFVESLFEQEEALTADRALSAWTQQLNQILERFFEHVDYDLSEVQTIRRELTRLTDLQTLSGFDGKIGFQAIRQHLGRKLERKGYGFGFLAGGLTFCSMLPMRSIPAKVICLIGMNGASYPRQSKQLGFDLIARHPRRGDRSRRSDDRYLFLETLLSARQTLYLSYIGQSVRDNSVIPASVVVEELIEYIEANYLAAEDLSTPLLVTKHRLQAFSQAYFRSDSDLFSYSSQNYEACQQLFSERVVPTPFIADDGLPEPPDEFRTVKLADLVRFYRNPAQFLFNKRLGIYLHDQADVPVDQESFALSGLDRYDVALDLMTKNLAGAEISTLKEAKLAAGQLPHGNIGEFEYETLREKVEYFVARTKPFVDGELLPPLRVDLQLGEFRLIGKIDNMNHKAFNHYRFARVRAKDQLRVWLYHLALNISWIEGYPRTSFLAGLDSMKEANWLGWSFAPLANGDKIMTELLQIYWRGLTRSIRFLPDSSLAFVRALIGGSQVDSALWRARKTWYGGDMERGEKEDLYLGRCFGEASDLFDESFQNISRQVWMPILTHAQEIG